MRSKRGVPDCRSPAYTEGCLYCYAITSRTPRENGFLAVRKFLEVKKFYYFQILVPYISHVFVHRCKVKVISRANVALGVVYGVRFSDELNLKIKAARKFRVTPIHSAKIQFYLFYLIVTIP